MTSNLQAYVCQVPKIWSETTKSQSVNRQIHFLPSRHTAPETIYYIPLYLSEQDFLSPSALSTHGCTVKLSVTSRTPITVRIQRESAGSNTREPCTDGTLICIMLSQSLFTVAWLARRLQWQTASAPPADDEPKDVTVPQAMPCFTLQSIADRPILAIDHRLNLSLLSSLTTAAASHIHHSFTPRQIPKEEREILQGRESRFFLSYF